MPNILLTGVTTLDIINLLECYPEEDTEIRIIEQQIRTGGNASNMALVMQQLGFDTYLLANRADDSNATQVFTQLAAQNIDISLCPVQENSSTPTSYITVNRKNGSRTICHYRNLQELHPDYFQRLDLTRFDWFHFEARNCIQLKHMLEYAKSFNKPVSIEVEKPRQHINDILEFADILLLSRPFAESQNFKNATDCLQYFSSILPDRIITCTWGKEGAWVYNNANITYQPASNISSPVETLGAGDTFNAAFISSIIQQHNIDYSLEFACKLAANKCLQAGFDNLIIPTI